MKEAPLRRWPARSSPMNRCGRLAQDVPRRPRKRRRCMPSYVRASPHVIGCWRKRYESYTVAASRPASPPWWLPWMISTVAGSAAPRWMPRCFSPFVVRRRDDGAPRLSVDAYHVVDRPHPHRDCVDLAGASAARQRRRRPRGLRQRGVGHLVRQSRFGLVSDARDCGVGHFVFYHQLVAGLHVQSKERSEERDGYKRTCAVTPAEQASGTRRCPGRAESVKKKLSVGSAFERRTKKIADVVELVDSPSCGGGGVCRGGSC